MTDNKLGSYIPVYFKQEEPGQYGQAEESFSIQVWKVEQFSKGNVLVLWV